MRTRPSQFRTFDSLILDRINRPISRRRLLPTLLRGWTRGDVILACILLFAIFCGLTVLLLPQHPFKPLTQAPQITQHLIDTGFGATTKQYQTDNGPSEWTEIETTIETPPVEVNGSQG